MPGIGVRTAAVLLVTTGDGSSFPTAAHLASYAGLAPATKSSGTSIHGEHARRTGNRQLKRAMFLSAFAALHDPASRDYYDRCRARGKTHTQALLRLARHRHQRPLRHVPRRLLPPVQNASARLTKEIEALPTIRPLSPAHPVIYAEVGKVQSFTSLYMFILPLFLAVAGFMVAFNIRGVADSLYLRSEKLLSGVFGGIGPRGMRFAGSLAFVFGTVGFSAEGAKMAGLI